MIVCNCNGLSEHDVRQAILAGAESPCEVFAYHDVQLCCEKCVPEIDDHLTTAATAPLLRLSEVA